MNLWSAAAIEPFMTWKNSNAVYSFPDMVDVRAILGECFDEVSVTYPKYEFGHCCPTQVMRSRH